MAPFSHGFLTFTQEVVEAPMSMLLILLMFNGSQPILGPITDCPLIVEVVDMSWSVIPGAEVIVRDERSRSTQTGITNSACRSSFPPPEMDSLADCRARMG